MSGHDYESMKKGLKALYLQFLTGEIDQVFFDEQVATYREFFPRGEIAVPAILEGVKRDMTIQKAAMIGFGTVSPGIVASWVLNGVDVNVYESSPEALNKGKAALEAELNVLVTKGELTASARDKALQHVHYVDSIEAAMKGAQFALEAVTENLDVKERVLAEMLGTREGNAIIATNTSSFALGQIAGRFEDFDTLGLYHVGLPAHLTDYVEAGSNDPETSQRIRTFVRQIHKEPVVVDTAADRAGHVWNILQADINSAALALLYKWTQGHEGGDVESTAKSINQAMHYLGTDWVATEHPLSVLKGGKYSRNDRLNAHAKTELPLEERAKEAYDMLQTSANSLALSLKQQGVEEAAIERSMRFLGTRWAATENPLMAMSGGGIKVHGTLMHNIIPTLPNNHQRDEACGVLLPLNLSLLPTAEQRLHAVKHFLHDVQHPDKAPQAPFAMAQQPTPQEFLDSIAARSAGLIATKHAAGMGILRAGSATPEPVASPDPHALGQHAAPGQARGE